MKQTVEVPIPPSANKLWKIVMVRGWPRMVRTEEYKSWLKDSVLCLRIGLKKIKAAQYPVRIGVDITGGKGWRADRDLGNVDKAIEDALKHAEIIVDDSVSYVRSVRLDYHPGTGQAKCLVSVEPIAEEM